MRFPWHWPLALTICAVMAFTACTTSVEIGGRDVPCLGIGEDADPRYRYDVDAWNVAGGIIFFGLIVPPVIVLADGWRCPVGMRRAAKGAE